MIFHYSKSLRIGSPPSYFISLANDRRRSTVLAEYLPGKAPGIVKHNLNYSAGGSGAPQEGFWYYAGNAKNGNCVTRAVKKPANTSTLTKYL